LNGEIQY